jgi:hypothetical protein
MSDLFVKRTLTAAFIMETFCVTYALKFPALVSIATVLYLILFLPPPVKVVPEKPGYRIFRINAYRVLLMVMMGVMMFHFAAQWMEDDPIAVKDADMLPVIKVMSQRFLQGHWRQVYAIIPEIWNGMKPIYLPAMWLPFSLPEALHIDVRWITVISLFISFSVFILLFKPYEKDLKMLFLAIAAFVLFWWLFTDETSGLVAYTEEGVVLVYYVLLVLALLKGNYWLIGLAISFCALSRYSFAGWIPALFIYLLLQKQWKKVGQLVITVMICLAFLLLLPFGWGVVENMIHLPAEYIHFAARVWNDDPEIYPKILGFSKFFGPDRIALQHHLLMAFSFIVPSLFVLCCWWWKNKRNRGIFNVPLAALKLTLVLFYSFIDVPYLYLFYTSSFVSLMIVTVLLRKKEDSKIITVS